MKGLYAMRQPNQECRVDLQGTARALVIIRHTDIHQVIFRHQPKALAWIHVKVFRATGMCGKRARPFHLCGFIRGAGAALL